MLAMSGWLSTIWVYSSLAPHWTVVLQFYAQTDLAKCEGLLGKIMAKRLAVLVCDITIVKYLRRADCSTSDHIFLQY